MYAEPQRVQIGTDNGKKLYLNGRGYVVTMSLVNTYADCSVPEGLKYLKDKLVDAFNEGRSIDLGIEKGALGSASDGHHMGFTWKPPDSELFTLQFGGSPKVVELISGSINEPTNTRVFEFSGGIFKVIDRSGPVRDHVAIECPNAGDVVTVTVAPL